MLQLDRFHNSILMLLLCGSLNSGVSLVYMEISNTNQRKFTWDLIRKLHNHDESAWIIGGDFNIILLNEEKDGGAPTSETQMDMFRSVLDECGLQNLHYLGDIFTWSNR